MNSTTKDRIIPAIQGYFATLPITKAWLFGSYARGEESVESDVDILVLFDKGAKISLLKYASIVCKLEEILNHKVDMVEEGSVLAFAQESVSKDRVLIYEKVYLDLQYENKN